jgi:hypothetical protein
VSRAGRPEYNRAIARAAFLLLNGVENVSDVACVAVADGCIGRFLLEALQFFGKGLGQCLAPGLRTSPRYWPGG